MGTLDYWVNWTCGRKRWGYGKNMKGIRYFLGAIALGILTVNCDADPAVGAGHAKENRLAIEVSPYLRLHAKNPVDWYPWGEEAFAKAKKENKPILLSIGYSTCHWCHVMERESFENKQIAEILNAHFVAIKLDREERPDVDKVYMTAYQAMTGQTGGWPLNMFLTPDLAPFFGGTYFPPTDRGGRVGFKSVLLQLKDAWASKQDEVVASAKQLRQHLLDSSVAAGVAELVPSVAILESAEQSLMQSGDAQKGGWGKGPKFPMPSNLRFLLRSWKRGGDPKVLDFVELTAREMAKGGIHDQLGGGFHRYTVDGKWLVPHFEKMLYDQAQLLDFYLDLYQITKKQEYAEVARSLCGYVLRDMRADGGAFYCAEDAQSEGKEGKYFCWTTSELKSLLDPAEFTEVCGYFGITDEGNCYDHSDPEALKAQNVLSLVKGDAWLGEKSGREALVLSGIKKMQVARSSRIRPSTDDKILASWNGMMIGALQRAGIVLGEEKYSDASQRAMAFVKQKMWDGKRLAHRWHSDGLDASVQAESYLLMLQASRRSYEMTLDPELLEFAVDLAEASIALFHDPENGGFYGSAVADDVIVRLKGDYDGAIPTASSIAVMEFLKLSEITGRKDFMDIAEGAFKAHGEHLVRAPTSLTSMLQALDLYHSRMQRLVLAVGSNGDAGFHAEIADGYRPNLTTMGNVGLVDDFEKGLKTQGEKTTAYLCEGESCKAPVTDAKSLWK